VRPSLQAGQGMVIFLMAVAAGLAFFYIYVYRQEARQARRLTGRQRGALRLLRVVVGLLAVLALARPTLTRVHHETRLPVLPILLDESTSMAFPDSRENPLVQANAPDKRRRYDTAQAAVDALQKKLTLTHRVKLFTFSDSSKLLKELPRRKRESDPLLGRDELFAAAPNPTGEYTNIGDGLRDVLRELSGDRISGVVLLSDGRQTGGGPLRDAGAQAADAKVPVHAVALGSEFPLRDLRIDEVIVDPEISLGDVLRFRLKITNQIRASLATKLTLF
jgi:hypothetical protein